MFRQMSVIGSALAVLMTVSVAAPAQDYVARQVDVAYGDLDLSTLTGRSALDARIDEAAAMACGGNPAFSSTYRDAPVFTIKAFEKCRAEARHEAVTSLNQRGVRVASRH